MIALFSSLAIVLVALLRLSLKSTNILLKRCEALAFELSQSDWFPCLDPDFNLIFHGEEKVYSKMIALYEKVKIRSHPLR
jgi:hypothetical protein